MQLLRELDRSAAVRYTGQKNKPHGKHLQTAQDLKACLERNTKNKAAWAEGSGWSVLWTPATQVQLTIVHQQGRQSPEAPSRFFRGGDLVASMCIYLLASQVSGWSAKVDNHCILMNTLFFKVCWHIICVSMALNGFRGKSVNLLIWGRPATFHSEK